MGRPIDGLILNEGYTDLGTFEVDITSVEAETNLRKNVEPQANLDPARIRLFKLACGTGVNVSTSYRAVFGVSAISTEVFTSTLYPNPTGYVQLNTPKLPITVLPDDPTVEKVIPMRVNGTLDDRQDECYLKVEISSGNYRYTLIKDIVVNGGYLCITDGAGHYYKIRTVIDTTETTIAVSGSVKAIYISASGAVSLYSSGSWGSPILLTFYSIAHPENLTSTIDGFYNLETSSAPATPWHLGDSASPFADYTATNAQPEPYFVNVHLDVFNGDETTAFYTHDFLNLMLGILDYSLATMSCPSPGTEDTSPTLSTIQSISGVTFSGTFTSFLTSKGLTTLNKLQKAGPITYINGFPSGIPSGQVSILQSHTDLYLINQDATQNQGVIHAGYTNVFDIATTPKNVFLGDVVSGGFALYNAANMHELALQGQKFLSLALAGTLGDYSLVASPSPVLSGSSFASTAFANNINACGCSDCQSMVSPFAYLMDLLKYCAERMDYNTSYDHNTPDYNAFIDLLASLFHQPFGTMNVSCETLHDEFCRVRMVTEVLEAVVAGTSLGPVASGALSNARNNYLMMVYKSLLRNAGTSIEELRNIISTANAQDKIDATQKWADRIGITLMVPPANTVLTSDRLWLTFGATVSTQILNADNLEYLFGFRSTVDPQINPTLSAKILDWKEEYLKKVWKAQDYVLTSYSRENSSTTSTPESNWKPIIDPDIIGTNDMVYNMYGPAHDLWKNRKADTDTFLTYYHGTPAINDVLSVTSADMNNRQIKVIDRNLLAQQLDNNEVQIPDSATTWQTFTVFSKALSKTDTILSLSKPTPVMFQPDLSTLKTHYKRVLAVPSGQTQTSSSFTIEWPTEVIADVFGSGYARLESSGDTGTIYATSGGTNSLSVSYPSGNKKATVTLGGTAPSSGFANGNVTFVYEVAVDIFTTETPDPEKIATKLFTRTETYTPISPAYASALTYKVFTTPTIAPWDTGISEYANLKKINKGLKDGTATAGYYSIIADDLHTTTETFSRMMELMGVCENYLSATFNANQPTEDELYEMGSIFRSCAKRLNTFREYWIKEELRYNPGGGAIMLMLSAQYFWKAFTEPQLGPWDPRLQTIPATTGAITSTHVPIIDPELLSKSDMLQYPANQIYLDLYDARALVLANQLSAFYIYWISAFGTALFEKILNYVANNNNAVPYNISPYADLEELLEKIQGNDIFEQAAAVLMAWSEFSLSKDEFIAMMAVKTGYESTDPASEPTPAELDKGFRLLVTAYKRKQLYFVATTGWIEEEVAGTYASGVPVKYYNVLPMKLAPGRADANDRSEWQKTLAAWNRQPIVNPDIVLPENIKAFITGEYAHDKWVNRKTAEDTLFTNLRSVFTTLSPNTNAQLLIKYDQQLDLLIARDQTITPISGTPYLKYFTEIVTREAAGEDITVILDQLGFQVPEYRYLRKIYDFIMGASSTATPTLLPEEYDDITNIMIDIRKRNLSFGFVVDEYNSDIVLSDADFVLFESQQVNFPQNTLPVASSPWRVSHTDQKNWLDTLDGRIERKQAITDKWKEVLIEVEDDNMPYLRDAIIDALRSPCETFNDAADRLAKTYFIETRDNCCVKYTRVAFAIETIQGLVFALQNGIYDEYATGFKLFAPYISREWQWIGSYATWRSAVFVFVYPENMLYPTLKRLQSPKFQDIADKLQNATKASPQDACDLGKEYMDYFNDVQDLEVICSTNAHAKPINDDPTGCCDEPVMNDCAMTYFFGQAPGSGKTYWSYKYTDDNSAESFSFWEELPMRVEAEPIGCYVFKDVNDKGVTIGSALWLFYTYRDNGKLTLAYLVKDISKTNTSWTDNKASDLPTFKESADNTYDPIYVVACQQSSDGRDPSFFVGYHSTMWGNYNCHVLFSRDTKKISPDKFDVSDWAHRLETGKVKKELACTSDWASKPMVAVNFRSDPAQGGGNYQTLAVGFQGKVSFLAYGQDATIDDSLKVYQLLGIYELNGNSGKLLVLDYNYNTHKKTAYVVKVTNTGTALSHTVLATITDPNLSPDLQATYRIYPVFASDTDFNRVFATGCNGNSGGPIGSKLTVNTSTLKMTGSNIFMLTPDGGYRQNVTSSECIPDMKARKLAIEQHMGVNANAPIGNVPSSFLCSTRQLEYLVEAYYFVPMLLALDQQQRGQYDAALEWYRTIYDYTESLAINRKIYYGLKLEENISTTYTHAPGWLLDPLNPHLIAKTRANSHTKYVLLNIIQCLFGYADRQYTLDTVETVPQARKFYTAGLDLLKVPELNKKTNACIDISGSCLDSGTIVNSDPAWTRMFEKLQDLLNSYSDPTVVQAMVNAVLSIFNGSGSMLDKFTAAFDYLYANPPVPGGISSVADVMGGLGDRMNGTYQYMVATNNYQPYYQAVSNSYQGAVANVSGINYGDVPLSGSATQIGWLNNPIPQNDTGYNGSFASSTGTQNLQGQLAFNPIAVSNSAFAANVAYSNAPVFANYQSPNQLPYTYVPLIDYNFCLPSNPVYSGLVLRGNLELYKIFNCRNIAGMVRELDPYAAATDSTTGIPVIGAGGTLNVPGNAVYSPSQYRFKVLIERAKQLVGQSQQLESLFLAALEKLDAENYSQLQARQGIETAKATVRLQDLRISQAQDEKQVTALQRDKATFMIGHFNTLLANGNNKYENDSIAHLQKSIDYMKTSLTYQRIAAALSIASGIAVIAAPPSEMDIARSKWMDAATALGTASSVSSTIGGSFSTQASIETTNSSISSQLASFERRNEEWEFQAQLATQDESIAKQQVQVADDNVRVVSQEREIAELNVTHAEETLTFLQNKFTNAALYGWMSGVLERCYSYMLNITAAVARTAERQLFFERQEQAGPFILNDYWETPSSGGPGGSTDRRGLTGSARLLVDITRLEQYAFDSFRRKLQMTKLISLGTNFPTEFQQFRETGVMNFQLTNKMFDYDFPGHYLRLINDIKTTLVGLVPVYDGIKATLTAETISYAVIGGNTFQKIPIKRLEVDSVALTSTNNASGVFEMQPMQGEILNPFEGMGVESRWEFKLPQFSNRFDFNNIADVLIAVNYTAIDSYLYRFQVLQELDNNLTFNRGFSFRNDFPDQWFELSEAEQATAPFGVTFELTRNMFPQGVLDLKLNKATNILLYFVRKDGYVKEVSILDLSLSTPQASTSYSGGDTIDGKFDAGQLMNTLGNSPVVKLRLLFDNIVENRDMFKDGSIQDILVIVPCKAELKSYPM